MHLIIGTRGSKESVELFIKELSSKYLPLPFRNKRTGKIVNTANPIHVRPFQLWEIIFPKETRDVVLTTVFPNKITLPDNTKIKKIYKWILRFLPKIIKKLPEEWDSSKKVYVCHDDVETVGFGMIEDETHDFKRSDEQMKSLGLDPKDEWEYEGL